LLENIFFNSVQMAEQQNLTLGYWAIRGRAQAIRFLLEYLGVSYKDHHYTNGEEWFKKDKPEIQGKGDTFANLPYLKDGDFYLSESSAIAHYVGEKFGGADLFGKTPQERARIAEALGALEDMTQATMPLLFNPDYENHKAITWDKNKGKFEVLLKALGNNKYLVDNKLTFADFRFYEQLQYVKGIFPQHYSEHAQLQAFVDNFESLKGIKEYLASEKFAPIKNHFMPHTAKWHGF